MLSRYGFGFAEKWLTFFWQGYSGKDLSSSGQYIEIAPLYYGRIGYMYGPIYSGHPGYIGCYWGSTEGMDTTEHAVYLSLEGSTVAPVMSHVRWFGNSLR